MDLDLPLTVVKTSEIMAHSTTAGCVISALSTSNGPMR